LSAGQPVPQAAGPPKRYRVLEARRISFNGYMTQLDRGSVVDPSGYGGMPGIKRLLEQGVKLQPEWD
jgi:hypothetical protein